MDGATVATPHVEIWIRRALLAAYVILGVVLVLHHEPWRDEADVWLVARDRGPAEIFRFGNYVGSPGLWYALVVPLAKLGVPYAGMGFLNLALAGVAVALFIWYAPFPWAVRALFVFSYFASYEYGVLARSYALSMALIFALAALDAHRLTRPAVFGSLLLLLFNTNVHSVIVAGAIVAAWGWEILRGGRFPARATSLLGLGIAVAGAVFAVIQLVPPPDGQLPGLAPFIGWRWTHISLAGAFYPTAGGPFWTLLAVASYAVAAISIAAHPRALSVMLASTLGLWALFVLKFPGSVRHWGFLLLATLYAVWIARVEDARLLTGTARETPTPFGDSSSQPLVPAAWTHGCRRILPAALALSFAWSVSVAFNHWQTDLRYPYSQSKAMARYLAAEGLTHLPIAAWPAPHCEALLPYLPGTRFYYPGIRDYGSHMRWTRECVEGWTLPEDEVVRRIEAAFPAPTEVLLLTNHRLPAAERAGFRLFHAEIGGAMQNDEQYILYHRGWGAP